MNDITRISWKICFVLVALMHMALAGCGTSASSRFYTLNPVRPALVDGAALNGSSGEPAPNIAIVSVEIPDYVDRPEVVTRTGSNSLHVAEYDRWGGDLRSDVTRVLSEALSSEFPDRRVAVTSGRRAVPADYRVAVNITRLDAVPGQDVWLRAAWSISGKENKVLVRRESNLNEPIKGRDTQSTVTAISNAVDRLGNQIAGTLKPLLANTATEKEKSGRIAAGAPGPN